MGSGLDKVDCGTRKGYITTTRFTTRSAVNRYISDYLEELTKHFYSTPTRNSAFPADANLGFSYTTGTYYFYNYWVAAWCSG